MFESTGGRGFQISFPNGLTVSVQWGYGLYCDNRHNSKVRNEVSSLAAEECFIRSTNAEVAVFEHQDKPDRIGNWRTRDFIPGIGDDVKGYRSPMEVADLIYRVSIATEG
jgi:hypothetical protein